MESVARQNQEKPTTPGLRLRDDDLGGDGGNEDDGGDGDGGDEGEQPPAAESRQHKRQRLGQTTPDRPDGETEHGSEATIVAVGALAVDALVTVEMSTTTTIATATSLVNTDVDGVLEVAEQTRASAEQEGTTTTDDTQSATAERDADGRTTHATTTTIAAVATTTAVTAADNHGEVAKEAAIPEEVDFTQMNRRQRKSHMHRQNRRK
jgi:hypothetical protein